MEDVKVQYGWSLNGKFSHIKKAGFNLGRLQSENSSKKNNGG